MIFTPSSRLHIHSHTMTMATENNGTNRQRVEQVLEKFVAFIDNHQWIVRVNTVSFFTEKMWERIVVPHFGDVGREIVQLTETEMARLPAGQLPPRKDRERDLSAILKFINECMNHRLENSGILCEVESVLNRLTFREKNHKHCEAESAEDSQNHEWSAPRPVQPKVLMNIKKSHEVEEMSHFTARLAGIHQLQKVVDIGSGKGYLGQYLSLQHGLDVIGIDSSDSNTHGARERNHKLQKKWEGISRHSMNNQQTSSQWENPKEAFKEIHTRRTHKLKNMQKFLSCSDKPSVDEDDSSGSQGVKNRPGQSESTAEVLMMNRLPVSQSECSSSDVNLGLRNMHECDSQSADTLTSTEIMDTKDGSGLSEDLQKIDLYSSDDLDSPPEQNSPVRNISQTNHNVNSSNKENESVESTTAPEESVESTTAPEESVESTTAPEESVESTTAPEESVESTTAPEESVESTTAPEESVESTSAPEESVESTTAPEESVESTTAQEESVESTTAPEESVESTTAPEESVESTTALEESVESTTAPEESVESTTAPGTSSYGNNNATRNGSRFCSVTAFVEPSTSLTNVVSKNAKETEQANEVPFMLIGLHTCGDLASSTLRLFVHNDMARVLLNVGCCYQKLSEEFETGGWHVPETKPEVCGFPMSQLLRSKGTKVTRPARMLASMAADRIASSQVVPAMGLFYRSVLQVLLRDHYRLPTMSENVGKLAPKCRTFLEYARKSLKKLQFDDSKLSDVEISAYAERYQPYYSQLQALNQLRVALSPTIEGLFMLDRLCYLQEQASVHSAALVRLFDPVTSPRCYAILAIR